MMGRETLYLTLRRIFDRIELPPSPQSAALATTTTSAATVPSNLLVTFLEYLSIIMQDTKTESSVSTIKLSFLVLLCVTEDQYANALGRYSVLSERFTSVT